MEKLYLKKLFAFMFLPIIHVLGIVALILVLIFFPKEIIHLVISVGKLLNSSKMIMFAEQEQGLCLMLICLIGTFLLFISLMFFIYHFAAEYKFGNKQKGKF